MVPWSGEGGLFGETTSAIPASGSRAARGPTIGGDRRRPSPREPIELCATWLDLASGRVFTKADEDSRALSQRQLAVLRLLLARLGDEIGADEVAAAADEPADRVFRFVYQLQSLIERDPLDPDHLLDTEGGWRFVLVPERRGPRALAAENVEFPRPAPEPVAAPPAAPPEADAGHELRALEAIERALGRGEVVAAHGDSPRAHALRAVAAALAGDVVGAEREFEAAHGADPRAQLWYALHLTLQRQPDRALTVLGARPEPDPIAAALYAVLRRSAPPREGEEALLLWRALEAWRAFASLARIAAELGQRPFVTVRMVLAARC